MAEVEVTRPSYYHPLGKIGSRLRIKANKTKESGESQKIALRKDADKGRHEPQPISSSTTTGRFGSKGAPGATASATSRTSRSPTSAVTTAIPLSPSSAMITPTILTYQRQPESPKATKKLSHASSTTTTISQRPGGTGGGGLIEGHPAMQPSIPLKAQQRRQSLQNAAAVPISSPTKRPVIAQGEEQPYRLTLQGPQEQQQQPLRLSMHAAVAAPPSSQPQERYAQPRPTPHHFVSQSPHHQQQPPPPPQQMTHCAPPQLGAGNMQQPRHFHQPPQAQSQPQSQPYAHSSHHALPMRLTLGAPSSGPPPHQHAHQNPPHGMYHMGRNDGHVRRQSIGAGQCQQQHHFQHCHQHQHEAYADPLRHSYHGGGGGGGGFIATSDGRHTVRLGDVGGGSGGWTVPSPPCRHPVIHPYHNPQQHSQHEHPQQHLGAMYGQPLTRDDSCNSLRSYIPSCDSIESGQLYLLQQLRAQDSQRALNMPSDHSTRSSRSSYRGPLAASHNVDAVDDSLRHSQHGGRGGGGNHNRTHVLRLGHAGDAPLPQQEGNHGLSQRRRSSHDGCQRHLGSHDQQRRSSSSELASDGSSRSLRSNGQQRPHRHSVSATTTGPSLLGYLEGNEIAPVPTNRRVARNGSSHSVQSQRSAGRRSSIGSQTSGGRRSSIGSHSSSSLLGQRDRHAPSAASPASSSHGRRAYARSLSDPYDGQCSSHTSRPAFNDGIRVRGSINHQQQHGPASPRCRDSRGVSDGIRVHAGQVNGIGSIGSTETNEASGIYPEVLRSPTRERRRLSGDSGIRPRSTATARVATIQLPSCPLVDYDGISVHSGSTSTRNERIRVGTSATPTPTLLDQDGIRVHSVSSPNDHGKTSAIQERGRSSIATPSQFKPNIEARALKVAMPTPDGATMDPPKRMRSQSGGRLEVSSTNKDNQQVKGWRNSITTSTNPSSRTTFV